MTRLLAVLAILGASIGSGSARAHPMAPSVLTFSAGDEGLVTMTWRSPSTRPTGQDLRPVVPSGCVALETAPPYLDESSSSVVQVSRLRCDDPSLVGQTISVEGLRGAKANVVVRVERPGGETVQVLLSPDRPRAPLPMPQAPQASSFSQYFALGVEHLATGWDHILFVLGLIVVLGFHRDLLFAVTAFTIGHSVTLGLASLGMVRLPVALVEILIAASLIVVALEIISPKEGPVSRHPMSLPALFGLLHGLGFARVLMDASIPQAEIPLALLGFNLGIEVGQLVLIAAAAVVALALRRIPRPKRISTLATAYLIGSLGAFWILQRAGQALGLVPF